MTLIPTAEREEQGQEIRGRALGLRELEPVQAREQGLARARLIPALAPQARGPAPWAPIPPEINLARVQTGLEQAGQAQLELELAPLTVTHLTQTGTAQTEPTEQIGNR